ncbi:Alcohol dehydrogenase [acceptor] [Lachnellula suecica]|uniref:Alcohol dehydrogenase [acceptor] n=1 Tax=Lachnellula suecica TaxID=602035 RepID=A0A8T9C910_9HELO|nr:Alcohol dehydrogenase [acceptor] [Lachnellula suecica]
MESYDYIVIGAGPAGTTLSSLLSRREPTLKVLLIEAGPDPRTTELADSVAAPMRVGLLRGSELDWNYEGAPQKHLKGRQIYVGAGKGLGGGTIINYGLWTRGDSKDYDEWARLVGDDRWSWKGFLPYFCKTEHHYDPADSSNIHGHDGPVYTASIRSSGRNYVLREPLKKAWGEVGIKEAGDVNAGSPLGLAECVEARTAGQRVTAPAAYPLDRMTVLHSTLVKKVLISKKEDGTKLATGVELSDGRQISAKREVVISAGSIRTPQILMLSGIGPEEELERHGIEQLVDSPEVGKNHWDHVGLTQCWKLQNPEIGAAIGSPKWTDPAFSTGNPLDWYTTSSVPQDELLAALSQDKHAASTGDDALVASPRCHLGLIVQYFGIPLDGSLITSYALNLMPTSRGTVTLSSTDPAANPIIDHNIYATEADRFRIRSGARLFAKMMSTPAGKEMVVGEAVPEGQKAISENSSDDEIDARFFEGANSIGHSSGTAAMGKVVDTKLKVKGIQGLRVVDASILPTPLTAPIQACMYALGEQAADIVLEDLQE